MAASSGQWGGVALVVLTDEVIPAVFAGILWRHPPEHEFAERIALHQAIEQIANLFGLPNELALDRWQNVFVRGDTVQGILNRATLLVHVQILHAIGKTTTGHSWSSLRDTTR